MRPTLVVTWFGTHNIVDCALHCLACMAGSRNVAGLQCGPKGLSVLKARSLEACRVQHIDSVPSQVVRCISSMCRQTCTLLSQGLSLSGLQCNDAGKHDNLKHVLPAQNGVHFRSPTHRNSSGYPPGPANCFNFGWSVVARIFYPQELLWTVRCIRQP